MLSRASAAFSRFAARALIDRSALPADVDATGIGVWLAPHAHVVHYPVRQGRDINIVVIAKGDANAETWSSPIARDLVHDRVARFHPRLQRLVAAALIWRQWPLVTRQPLPSYAQGLAALVGDAAHPTLPFLAQGAVMALEDAETLVAQLQSHTAEPELAFSAYSARRHSRTQRLIAAASRNGRIYHLAGPLANARNLSLRVIPPSLIMRSYDWIYGKTDAPNDGK